MSPSVRCIDTPRQCRTRPEIIHFLYDRLPVQCKQCGIRFADSTSGKKDMQDHLDMHFRQNRKANQNIGRRHGHGWFVGVEVRRHSTLLPDLSLLNSIGLDARHFNQNISHGHSRS